MMYVAMWATQASFLLICGETNIGQKGLKFSFLLYKLK